MITTILDISTSDLVDRNHENAVRFLSWKKVMKKQKASRACVWILEAINYKNGRGERI